MSRPYIETAIDLVKLIRLFEGGAELGVKDIAGMYGKGPRTAQRWVSEIDLHFFALEYRHRMWRKAR